MKKVMIGLSSLMFIGQIVGLIYFIQPKTTEVQERQPEEAPSEPAPLYAEETIDYSLQNGELHITFDQGEHWTHVPLEIESLFAGEYSGNQQDLIKNSYMLTEDLVGFIYSEDVIPYGIHIKWLYSLDQGESWQQSVITENYPSIRFRKIGFLNGDFGYAIMTGDRTMSQELSNVFLTNDGGKSWRETNNSNMTSLLADGGFVDEQTGFLSYGTLNPEQPTLFVTHNAGDTWTEAIIDIPEKYSQIFVIAETPVKEEDHLAILINQGPNGDYQGGKIKGKFISKDNGMTWEFSKEVEPIE